jgi:hypothetical protein
MELSFRIWRFQVSLWRWILFALLAARPSLQLLGQTATDPAKTAPSMGQELRDGERDFDFNVETWTTHIRCLLHPFTGSDDWVELDGSVHVQTIWGGRAQLEEIEADGATGRFEGLTLFLYNRQAHQWGQYFANSAEGVLNPGVIGEFRNGRGEFLKQESFKGRTLLVLFVWSDILPDSHHVEQSISDDGGRTWEPNFVAILTRKNAVGSSNEAFPSQISDLHDGSA